MARKNDEADIQALLEDSWFVGEAAVQTADDSTATPGSVSAPWIAADTFPFYTHWVRWIERPVSHAFDIIINGDSADVTITALFTGTPPFIPGSYFQRLISRRTASRTPPPALRGCR
jgi:hypothetical protein